MYDARDANECFLILIRDSKIIRLFILHNQGRSKENFLGEGSENQT